MTLESAATPTMPPITGLTAQSGRLQVLDILRGFAILGMVVAHINDYGHATGGGAIGATIQQAIKWFVIEKAYTTFAILFGVGCAIQLHRANTREEEIRWRFLRRLLGVWGIIMVLIALTSQGGTVITYTYSGVWLLLIRRWSTRALILVLLANATFPAVWNAAVGSYQWATMGVERANTVYRSPRPVSPARRAVDQQVEAARHGTSYPRFVVANVKLSQFVVGPLHADFLGDWQRGRPGLLLGSLGPTLMFFVIGLLAFRRGVFDRPTDHRRFLIAVMFAGAALWIVDQWQLYKTLWPWSSVLRIVPAERVAAQVQSWFLFGLAPGWFLGLTYMAGITLLVGFSKAWERRLAAIFAAAGRMALTNYIIQYAVLSTVFLNWGFGLRGKFTPQVVPGAAVILYATLAIFSRWWLARFRLGPAEWLLRSVTYARTQSVRRPVEQAAQPV